ncbi:MAG: hypothetical protein EOP83_07805 [Verrucomicrobiaceae bacterium]|nr:MAG: hypothetical protein EOP83_07805 [Verrucomicrobiaceae bacterium]
MKIAKVIWRSAAGLNGGARVSAEVVADAQVEIRTSVGFIMQWTEDAVILCQSTVEATHHTDGVLRIPVKSIRELIEL